MWSGSAKKKAQQKNKKHSLGVQEPHITHSRHKKRKKKVAAQRFATAECINTAARANRSSKNEAWA